MRLQHYWYKDNIHPLMYPLIPFSWIFRGIASVRRTLYKCGIKKTHHTSLPVIIVGNITAGGTGKTPFVIWLASYLSSSGKKPGIALRGVGGKKKLAPFHVTASSDPADAGDEAVLLAQHLGCPVVACINRVIAVHELKNLGCDIVICDDGLQHYRLARDLEIAIVDGQRRFGNGLHLPAGPLREPLSRLKQVDFVVTNETDMQRSAPYSLQLKMDSLVAIHDPKKRAELNFFSGKQVHAIAGIGHPQRFFAMLEKLNIAVIPHIFPDHHQYKPTDLDFHDNLPIIMTEKDAVKCRLMTFKQELWALVVKPEVNKAFEDAISNKLAVMVGTAHCTHL